MQKLFDWLYQRSAQNRMHGVDLYNIIISENNILLAYRMIKANKGSNTKGSNQQTISDIQLKNKNQFISEIRECLNDFVPDKVKRVEIPKRNGQKRPLGIPSIRDRIIQQMFLQVLEPICEAKFYNHNYGFRPNRSAQDAMGRCSFLINMASLHYVVDIDIKGFFDNVNHTKLLSQLYTVGVKDKRVLAIIGKMLKAPILGLGVPKTGTPQGSILSPLLSNVVLNDLDWWVSSQWENFPTRHVYHKQSKIKALKRTNLKEMYIVRYADDFKIFTRESKTASKIFHATKSYLKKHLKLDISPEKSKITNLRKRSSEFLGFEIKAIKKRNKHVARTSVSQKSKDTIKKNVKKHIYNLQKYPNKLSVSNYNSYVLGVHNYYGIATQVSKDFSEIAYSLLYTTYNRLKSVGKYEVPRSPPKVYSRIYKNKSRAFRIEGQYLFPIADIKWKYRNYFSQTVCDYSVQGRNARYKKLHPSIYKEIQKMLKCIKTDENMDYADNRISKYSMQNGKCAVTGKSLTAEEVHCHHILPKYLDGKDTFDNLVVIHMWVHQLIHATGISTIKSYKQLLKLTGKQLEKVNKYREKCNLFIID